MSCEVINNQYKTAAKKSEQENKNCSALAVKTTLAVQNCFKIFPTACKTEKISVLKIALITSGGQEYEFAPTNGDLFLAFIFGLLGR